MQKIFPDLWQSELGGHFGLDLKIYLLHTPKGNVAFYYTDSVREQKGILSLGGVKAQFISHHHEFQPGLFMNLKAWAPELVIHRLADPYLQPSYGQVRRVDGNFENYGVEVWHTPGHTDNNLCFYYRSPFGKNYLFTGDTLYLDNGTWNYLIMPHEGGSKATLIDSLSRLRQLEVDVLCCSVAVGKNESIEVDQTQWHQIIDTLIARLRG